MKDWILGRRLMAEAGGEGGGGTGGGEGGTGGEGGAGGTGGGEEQPKGDQGGEGGEEEHNNALGDELNKGGDPKPGDKPNGEEKPKDQPDPNAPTEEEAKAYKEAIKLDENAFGKDARIDDRYMERLPALFKKHGLDPAKANALANDFVKMQKDVEKDAAERVAKFREWRQGEMKKMNDAYLKEYDQAGRGDIARAITHFFPKGSPMYQAVCMTEVGVDPGFLKAMKFIGERLPKDAAPGAAAGAGAGGGKSLSDSFMGL